MYGVIPFAGRVPDLSSRQQNSRWYCGCNLCCVCPSGIIILKFQKLNCTDYFHVLGRKFDYVVVFVTYIVS